MGQPPIIGAPANTNNPLVVLNEHLGNITEQLKRLGGPDLPHRYGIAEANDPGGHGRVWGTYCLACSDAVGQFSYPCQLPAREVIDSVRPPAFFTVGDVFEIDPLGRMVKYVPPPSS